MKIVTSGQDYIDIDALACGIAYKELLKMQGEDVEFVNLGSLNASIPQIVQDWDFMYRKTLPESDSYEYIIVDISDPEHFADFVEIDKVIEIFDHHFGYEVFWEQRLGENSKIEKVGSCTTLIWEEYKKANLNSKISALAANLIYTATISNTLNLKASVTDDRDINTLKELEGYTDLPTNCDEMFFEAVESTLLKNPAQSMINDTKYFEYNGKKFVIIQVELWDSKEFIDENREEIKSQLRGYDADYAFFTSPSISDGINYMLFSDQRSKELINSLVEIDFHGDLAKTKQLFLRKELIKLIREGV